MAYQKGDIIDGYKVLMLLKTSTEDPDRCTYRVRGTDGLLYVMKTSITEMERQAAHLSQLFVEIKGNAAIYRHVAGELLSAHIKRLGPISDPEVKMLTERLLHQLMLIHEGGYVHGGISTDNVMLELSGSEPMPWLIGLSHADSISEQHQPSIDLMAIGKLMQTMLYGTDADDKKIRIRVGAEAIGTAEYTMQMAISGAFASAQQMIDVLGGKCVVDMHSIKSPKYGGFAAVGGMDDIKQRLRDDVINILADREGAQQYGLTIPNGMLLYGPPGCGKTFIAECFAQEAGYNYRYVSASDLASTYIHGTQEKIAAVFAEARKNAPTILCFDEFDAMVPKRDETHNTSLSSEVNEFLTQLNNCGADGVFVIATSNRPDRIDSAVLRSGRIDYKLYVPLPDEAARAEILRIGLKKRPTDSDIDYQQLAQLTEGYISSDITTVVQEAAREAFRKKVPISMDILRQAIAERRPSLTPSMIAQYEALRKTIEKGNEDKPRSVGFV